MKMHSSWAPAASTAQCFMRISSGLLHRYVSTAPTLAHPYWGRAIVTGGKKKKTKPTPHNQPKKPPQTQTTKPTPNKQLHHFAESGTVNWTQLSSDSLAAAYLPNCHNEGWTFILTRAQEPNRNCNHKLIPRILLGNQHYPSFVWWLIPLSPYPVNKSHNLLRKDITGPPQNNIAG